MKIILTGSGLSLLLSGKLRKKAKEIALALIKQGLGLHQISQATNLPVEEIVSYQESQK